MQPATVKLLGLLARREAAEMVLALCSGPTTAHELADRAGLSVSQISRDLRELEALGIAIREKSEATGPGRPKEQWTIPDSNAMRSFLESADEFAARSLEAMVRRHRQGMADEYGD